MNNPTDISILSPKEILERMQEINNRLRQDHINFYADLRSMGILEYKYPKILRGKVKIAKDA
jgi:hypothetical protein